MSAGEMTATGRPVRAPLWSSVGGGVVIVVLMAMPFLVEQSATTEMVHLFILVVIASMWNLLAGYAGLISVGQQAYIGLGAYAGLFFALRGVQPYIAVVLGAIVCGIIAIPGSWLALRLRGDYFAVGTWVIAEVVRLVVIRFHELGGPSGVSMTQLNSIDPTTRGALTYWVALAVLLLTVAGIMVLLRSRLGLALTAVRDNETAARSLGVNVPLAKRIVYVVAAAGAGAAGGVLLTYNLGVQPDADFSVQWSAYMIFIVVIGGIGRVEGPIIGALVFWALEHYLSSQGAWYLIILGLVAVAAAIWLPKGIWGFFSDRTGIRLFPTGYYVDGLERAASSRSRSSDSDRPSESTPSEAAHD
jgi:branched-chain amino acid transport system permease protein